MKPVPISEHVKDYRRAFDRLRRAETRADIESARRDMREALDRRLEEIDALKSLRDVSEEHDKRSSSE